MEILKAIGENIKSQTDIEIIALTEAARGMSFEELKFIRKMAEKLAKRQ